MSSNFFFGISLTGSFLAGALALFAPCCITFLFPSYLGTIFKERKNVMFYTLIFALGLASILIPVALGFRVFIFFFDQYHQLIYFLGGLFLIFMGFMTIKPLFIIPQIFHTKPDLNKKVNIFSVFSLGLMSGLSSSCCAPVLFAAVTLTSLAPNTFQSIIVSSAYVLGIVFPLFIMSLFYEKLTEKISGKNRQKIYEIFKYLGAGIFILSGILIIIFDALNKIQMYQMEKYTKPLRLLVFELSKYFQNPIIDILIFGFIIFIFYKLIKKNEDNKKTSQ
ncbi:MAG: Cytochrome c biogenesis protein transmembrane region [Candidatus Roizmanbacteria bacterium GW2011_GWA2_35_8]|uniref:Cytochrome c biogenesis protein transmembrane region n=1 Tax=Candidatus Roizmanbacteria bacterium GW2011_GWA2_35_8 TaxID=1618479 RepID=A0A0G0DAK6_9BACT|nr:MAG: Cytochrome c biogenesis protein transmembrane region [Candidatus Roizmanbacteria bacterium GW2011_GWA2_35_8]